MAVEDSEISEFGFGYTVTSQLEHLRIGGLNPFPSHWWWPLLRNRHARNLLIQELMNFGLQLKYAETIASLYAAPFIPTQRLERTFPVDLAMNVNGIFHFLQFKRSQCVTDGRGIQIEKNELKTGALTTPFYRVKFSAANKKTGKHGDREQWDNLRKLEAALMNIPSALVRYVAPAFHTLPELSTVHQGGLETQIDGRWSVLCFRASTFSLPDDLSHHISYDGVHTTGWRYSDVPEKVPNILPLVTEIQNKVENARPVGPAMKEMLKHLDGCGVEMGLASRPDEISDREFLRIFGIEFAREESELAPEVFAFLSRSIEPEIDEGELANGIRKMLTIADGRDEGSRLDFINDFYGADYRCRQILGQPLVVGVSKRMSR